MKYTGKAQIKKEFQKALIERGKTQEEVAKEIGISRQALSSILRKQHIAFDDVVRLFTPLGYRLEFEIVKEEE